jgi:hypothetical protein
VGKIAETEAKRARYQEMAAENVIAFEELRARLVELEESRKTAERELASLRTHEEYVFGLERDRDALLDSPEVVAPERLDALTLKQRHHFYKILKVTVLVYADGRVEVIWAGALAAEAVCKMATLSPGCCRPEALWRGSSRSHDRGGRSHAWATRLSHPRAAGFHRKVVSM